MSKFEFNILQSEIVRILMNDLKTTSLMKYENKNNILQNGKNNVNLILIIPNTFIFRISVLYKYE